MTNQAIKDSLVNLTRANRSLHEAIQIQPRSNIIVSAIIKNFEFNYELSWKAMRRLLAYHGVSTSTPRQAIAEAYRKSFIDSDSFWIAMIEDRNLTVHTCDEKFASDMSRRIEEDYLKLFDLFLLRLEQEVQKT